MIAFENFVANVAQVRSRIADVCERCGRSRESVLLLPVTKNHPVDAPIFAAKCGFAAIGENRVQEVAEKKPQFLAAGTDFAGTEKFDSGLQSPGGNVPALRWELIGHLQSNKAKKAAELFDRIQSVDSENLIAKLDHACAALGKKMLILLQANPGSDPAKFGTADLDSLKRLVDAALAAGNLRLDGLMCVAPIDDDSLSVAARAFETLRSWRDAIADEYKISLPELSMGMSHDLEPAIAAGSTMIRVGTALFGARDYGNAK